MPFRTGAALFFQIWQQRGSFLPRCCFQYKCLVTHCLLEIETSRCCFGRESNTVPFAAAGVPFWTTVYPEPQLQSPQSTEVHRLRLRIGNIGSYLYTRADSSLCLRHALNRPGTRRALCLSRRRDPCGICCCTWYIPNYT